MIVLICMIVLSTFTTPGCIYFLGEYKKVPDRVLKTCAMLGFVGCFNFSFVAYVIIATQLVKGF